VEWTDKKGIQVSVEKTPEVIKMKLNRTGWEGKDGIQLAHDRPLTDSCEYSNEHLDSIRC
jgi:hypothetical protein